jgi:hypothetical protein
MNAGEEEVRGEESKLTQNTREKTSKMRTRRTAGKRENMPYEYRPKACRISHGLCPYTLQSLYDGCKTKRITERNRTITVRYSAD